MPVNYSFCLTYFLKYLYISNKSTKFGPKYGIHIKNFGAPYGAVFMILFFSISVSAQDLYKTPSGQKYHLATCRMVENVSKKLLGHDDISNYNLTACKICKPTLTINALGITKANKAVGTSKTMQCKGQTHKGSRCKHTTSLANGYCYQHTEQNSGGANTTTSNYQQLPSNCGAKTKSGGFCKRKVNGGGRCYQHS